MKRRDYMGVMVINHYVSETPISCYGTQIPVKAVTEIAIHEGGYDDSDRIIKGKQLAKIRMSDLQFGKLIAKPNSQGHPCTLESVKGFDVNKSHMAHNPAESKLANAILRSEQKDVQTSRFVEDLLELIDESEAKKRIVKKAEILHILSLIQRNSLSNFSYAIREVGEIGMNRVVEAKSQIHNIIRNSYRLSTQPLAIESSVLRGDSLQLSCFAEAAVNHTSGTGKLFDSVGTHAEYLSFHIMAERTDRVQSEIDKIEAVQGDVAKDKVFISNKIASVYMSLEQYARFVRADSTEVPCTLKRVGAYMSQDNVEEDRREALLGDIDGESKKILSQTIAVTKAAEALLTETGCKRSADRDSLFELCRKIKRAFEASEDDTKEFSKVSSNNVMKAYQQEISEYTEDELLMLPDDLAKEIRPLLSLKR